jgi:hypothetical protein
MPRRRCCGSPSWLGFASGSCSLAYLVVSCRACVAMGVRGGTGTAPTIPFNIAFRQIYRPFLGKIISAYMKKGVPERYPLGFYIPPPEVNEFHFHLFSSSLNEKINNSDSFGPNHGYALLSNLQLEKLSGREERVAAGCYLSGAP